MEVFVVVLTQVGKPEVYGVYSDKETAVSEALQCSGDWQQSNVYFDEWHSIEGHTVRVETHLLDG